MHFSIPDTSELTDNNGSSYTVFNMHINGVYHCSVRYSLFHSFNEQLKKEFGAAVLPQFPPKKIKILKLTSSELDERRSMIERFIQLLSQNPQIANSDTFNRFLLQAQQESQKAKPEDVKLDIFLMNGHKITVNIISTDQTDCVLEAVTKQIDLPSEYTYYFGLFLIKKEDGKDSAIVRKLQDFESPFISLTAANRQCPHRIVLRKSYWDPSMDDELVEDRIAMNLLHVQAVNDVERGWIQANKEQMKQLTTLQERNSRKEYLRFARTLKYYGYIQFKPCLVDYPRPDCRAIISAGNKELNFRLQVTREDEKEASFKVTRMRCWRITTMIPESSGDMDVQATVPSRLELAFEYLIAKDTLKWVTVTSDQAILMSMCLQGMVDELIMKRGGGNIKRPLDRNKTCGSSNLKRQTSSTSNNSTSEQKENTSLPRSQSHDCTQLGKSDNMQGQVKRSLSQYSNGTGLVASTSENDAFEGIGDDDL